MTAAYSSAPIAMKTWHLWKNNHVATDMPLDLSHLCVQGARASVSFARIESAC